MNRGLALALILLAFIVTLIGADTVLLSDAISENESSLSACKEELPASPDKVAALKHALEENRFLFSVSLPLSYISEYEEALAALEAAAALQDKNAFAAAHAEASQALAQMKRSALFSFGQIF